MVTAEGASAIIRSFALPQTEKSGYRLDELVLGNMVRVEGGEEIDFVPVYNHTLQLGQMYIINDTTLRVSVIIDSDSILDGFDVLEYTVMRLVCVNGDVFAQQGFATRTIGAGLKVTAKWEITLDDIVSDMVDKTHRHRDKSTLDKLGEDDEGFPTFEEKRLNRPRWRGGIW